MVVALGGCASQKPNPLPPSAAAATSASIARVINSPSNTSSRPPIGSRTRYSSVSTSQRFVALTFDDGPHAVHTPRLLDILREKQVVATFYVLGDKVQSYPGITRRIVAEGHELGNHTWSHPLLTKLNDASVRSELQRTRQVIKQVAGVEVATFRPPYGGLNERQGQWIRREFGYPTIMWSVDPRDWKDRNAAVVTQRLLDGAHPGGILLAHDIHATTIAAMPATIDGLKRRGYRLVTVSQLLALEGRSLTEHGAPPELAVVHLNLR